MNLIQRPPIPAGVPYIWKGIYSDFREVPAVGQGHAAQDYIEITRSHTRAVWHQFRSGSTKPPEIPSDFASFPLLASITGLQGRRLTILDVGGGMGLGYIYLRASAPWLEEIKYSVVEVEEVSRAGREVFQGDQQIQFLREFPSKEELGPVDLVQFCSSLQYMEDYQAALTKACSYGARFLYLLKIPVGDFPTFVTAQHNLPGSVIPVWFINHQALVSLCREQGYSLVFHATHDRDFDTTNFAPAYRMKRYSHLLFART
jgi:putative methyltransferase (TIGR04325 family)